MPIPGLCYVSNYIPYEQQLEWVATIDASDWMTDLKRRVQHYGYKYDYRARVIDETMQLGPLPAWAQSLAERLHAEKFIRLMPDQVIVNEYEPGQGIAPHVDCVPCFEDTIISISLGSTCLMDFQHVENGQTVSLWLEAGSLLVMDGEARFDWKHGIVPRKTDVYKGQKVRRARRISLTFRKVILAV